VSLEFRPLLKLASVWSSFVSGLVWWLRRVTYCFVFWMGRNFCCVRQIQRLRWGNPFSKCLACVDCDFQILFLNSSVTTFFSFSLSLVHLHFALEPTQTHRLCQIFFSFKQIGEIFQQKPTCQQTSAQSKLLYSNIKWFLLAGFDSLVLFVKQWIFSRNQGLLDVLGNVRALLCKRNGVFRLNDE